MKKVLPYVLIILTILFVLFAIGSVIYASIMQVILCWRELGFWVLCLIPDESAYWFLGVLALVPAFITFRLFERLGG